MAATPLLLPLLACPGCGTPFPVPADAVGALIDCADCGWLGPVSWTDLANPSDLDPALAA